VVLEKEGRLPPPHGALAEWTHHHIATDGSQVKNKASERERQLFYAGGRQDVNHPDGPKNHTGTHVLVVTYKPARQMPNMQ
jgi:hypothetical protein